MNWVGGGETKFNVLLIIFSTVLQRVGDTYTLTKPVQKHRRQEPWMQEPNTLLLLLANYKFIPEGTCRTKGENKT